MIFGIRLFPNKKENNPGGSDILLTGIPRSGTTLACRLLNQSLNVIALNEPMEPSNFLSKENASEQISKSIMAFRQQLYKTGEAPSKHRNGHFVDNNFSQEGGTRKRVVERSLLSFGKPFRQPFTLVLKHNAEFAQLLPELSESFTIYAVIRNPLAVLISWKTVEIPVAKGRISKSEHLSPDLHHALQQIDDLNERQLVILDWYFRQFQNLPDKCILRYEDIIRTGGAILGGMTGSEITVDVNLTEQYRLPPGGLPEAKCLMDNLKKWQGSWLKFYKEEDIEILLDHLTRL